MRASYSPSFGAKILKQVVALVGFSDGFRPGDLYVLGDEVYGRWGVASLNGYSSGKRHIRMFCTVPSSSNFPNQFKMGLCGAGTLIDADNLDFAPGNNVYFANRVGVDTGVARDDVGESYGYGLFQSDYLRQDWVFDIKADFDNARAIFTVFDGVGDEVFTYTAVLPVDEYRVFIHCGGFPRMKFDFTGESFDVAPGYKAWDAL